MDYDNDGMPVHERRSQQHYYGDTARILFIMGAVLLLVASTTGADLPLSPSATIAAAVILVVAGGVTNPAQTWVHWVNEIIAILGVLIFGNSAIANYRAGASITNSSYIYTEIIAILALIALYYTTKTIRGNILRAHLS